MKIVFRIKYLALMSLLILPTLMSTALAIDSMPKSVELLANKQFSYSSPELRTKADFSGMIIDYKETSSTDDAVNFYVRFKNSFGTFTEWVLVEPEIDTAKAGIQKSYLVNTNLTNIYQYKIQLNAGNDNTPLKFSDLKFTFINAKGTVANNDGVQIAASSSKSLKMISRSSWGAVDNYNYTDTKPDTNTAESDKSAVSATDPDIDKIVEMEKGKYLLWPYEYMKKVKMIVIHHTASTTDLNDPTQAIRNIQYYHAVRRGWGDIGYNYIMDQDGNLYEGRKGGEKIVGGHAIPVNKASIGIAVIGNFETQKVPKAVTNGLVQFIQEKAALYDLSVTKNVKHNSKSYPVVGGHKDNSATACPGQNLYDLIPTIKKLAGSGATTVTTSNAAKLDLDYLDTDPLRDSIELKPAETKTIKIVLKNTGKQTWSKDTTYLSVYDRETFREYLTFDNLDPTTLSIAKLKESTVSSGRNGTFEIKVTGGIKSGYLPLNIRGVVNGSIKSKSPILLPISIEEADFSFKINKNSEIVLKPGEEKKVQIKIQNTGNIVWNSYEQKVKIGVSNPKDLPPVIAIPEKNQTTGRIGFLTSTTVKPGASVTYTLNLKAPKTHTNKVLTESYSLVMDGVSWFTGNPITVKVNYDNKSLQTTNNVKSNVALASTNTKNQLGVTPRIHISKFANTKATVKTGEAGDVYVDGKLMGSVKSGNTIVFEQNSSNVSVTFNKNAYQGKIARFVPSKAEAVSEISDFKNPPAWNQNLNDNQYRATFEFRVIDNKFHFINEIPLELYVKGLGEVSNGDPIDKVKTIMVAARSYAYYYTTTGVKFKDKPYNLDDDPNKTQKYIGYGLEKRSPNIAKAVDQTEGEIITHKKKSVVIPYFSQSDGRTRSAKEVWNWDNAPYLNSVKDTYCATPTKLLGHGVGISGCGATGLANEGYNYKEIIKYFLKDVEITTI